MKKLNVAIVGTGRIASGGHAPALLQTEHAQLWSVMSRDRDRAADFAAKFKAQSKKPAHTTLDSLLQDPDLDAVIIATPDKLHAEQAVAAARAVNMCCLKSRWRRTPRASRRFSKVVPERKLPWLFVIACIGMRDTVPSYPRCAPASSATSITCAACGPKNSRTRPTGALHPKSADGGAWGRTALTWSISAAGSCSRHTEK